MDSKKKWYQNISYWKRYWIFILLFFPFVVPVILWQETKWSNKTKTILVICWFLLLIMIGVSNNAKNRDIEATKKDNTQNNIIPPTSKPTIEVEPTKVNKESEAILAYVEKLELLEKEMGWVAMGIKDGDVNAVNTKANEVISELNRIKKEISEDENIIVDYKESLSTAIDYFIAELESNKQNPTQPLASTNYDKGDSLLKKIKEEQFSSEKSTTKSETEKEDVTNLTHEQLVKISNDNPNSIIGKTYNMTLYLEQAPISTDADFMSQNDVDDSETMLIRCYMSSSDLSQLDGDSAQQGIHKPYDIKITFKKTGLIYEGDCVLK